MADEIQPLTETRVQEMIDTSLVNLRNATELFKTRSSAPTHIPKNIYEQIWLTSNILYWYDVDNNIWKSIIIGGLLDFDDTGVTVSNTTVETALATYSVPAGMLGTGNMIKMSIYLDTLYANGSGQNLYLRAKYGSDTILFSDNDFDDDASKDGWLEFKIIGAGTTSTQSGIFTGQAFQSGFDNVGNMHELNFVSSDTGFTQDSTVAKDLEITAQFSSASPNNSISTSLYTVELLTT